MAMSTSSGSGVNSEPNVTPLIDVMLVLLIIFMIVTPLINSGFQAQPPVGINIRSNPEENGDQILGIDADGNYYLNKRRIENSSLPEQLKAIYDARTTDKILYLKADKNLQYSKIIDAIDIASHSGVRVMAAITDQQPGTRSTVPGDIITPTTPNNKQP
jgi:biopolymer transport protein ExbD